jgi:hypothetical protein
MSIPAVWFMAKYYGAVGAACVWPGLNGIYILIGVPLTHRRLLKGGAWRWLGEVGLPLVPVLLIALIGKEFVANSMSAPVAIGALSMLFFCATGAAALVSPSIRPWLFDQILRAKISW